MRIAITLATAVALLLLGSAVTVSTSETSAGKETTKSQIRSYPLHFGQRAENRYCPRQVGRTPEPEFLLPPC